MINSITEAVSKAIHETFGNGYKIYKEDVKQGIKTPCFIIFIADSSCTKLRGEYDVWTFTMNIVYMPSDINHVQRECNEVKEKLRRCLDVITMKDKSKTRGSAIDFVISDDTLVMMIAYKIMTRTQRENDNGDLMEKMSQNLTIKETNING